MSRILKRLEAAERVNKPDWRPWHTLIGKYGDTEADFDARRDRMIAEGKALPDDEFIYIFIV